jgi:hypothetical protein
VNPRPPLPDRGGRVPRRSDVHCASAHDHRTGRPRCVPLPAHRCLGTPLRDLAVNRQCLGRYVDRPEPNPAAAACSLSLSMRIREMCLGMVLLDGASVSDPYCDQNTFRRRKSHPLDLLKRRPSGRPGMPASVRPASWALAASGANSVAAPASAMNSRRFIPSPRRLPTKRIAHRCGRGLLHCGSSIRSMSAAGLGQSPLS